MKTKVLLTLLFLTIFALIISYGCGSGSGTTQPVALFTPTPNYTGTGDMAYITFNVIWPKNGKAGKLNTLSKNGKQITVSDIDSNTNVINIYIFDFKAMPTPTSGRDSLPWNNVLASGNIHHDEIQKTFGVKLISKPGPGSSGPPPAIPVIIWAEALDAHNVQLSHTDLKDSNARMDLKVGNQAATLTLNTNEKAKATSGDILLQYQTTGTGKTIQANIQIQPTPTPALSGETEVKARVWYDSSDYPDPTVTPLAGDGIANCEVKYTIKSGVGELLPMDGSTPVPGGTPNQGPLSAFTDPNGYCKVKLRTDRPGTITVHVETQLDPTDPNTIIGNDCDIQAIAPTPIPPTPFPTSPPPPPSFSFTTSNNYCTAVNEPVDINVTLLAYSGTPIPSETLNYTITMPDTTVTTGNAVTDGNGKCTITVPGSNSTGIITFTIKNSAASATKEIDVGDYYFVCSPCTAGIFRANFAGGLAGSPELPDHSYELVLDYYYNSVHPGYQVSCYTGIQTTGHGLVPYGNQTVTFSISQPFPGGGDKFYLYSQSVDPNCTTDSSGGGYGYYYLILHVFTGFDYVYPTTQVIITGSWATKSGKTVTAPATLYFHP